MGDNLGGVSEEQAATELVQEADGPQPVGARLEAARAEVARAAKSLAELDKALALLARQAARLEASPLGTLEAAQKAREWIAKAGVGGGLDDLAAEIEEQARGAAERASRRFGTVLAAALKERLGETHELRALDSGFVYGAMRILPDAGRVRIEYARQTVLKNLAADADAVANAVAKVLAELDKPALDPELYLRHLHLAYQQCVSRSGKQAGEMVDILDFWGYLTWELQPDAFRREPTSRRFRDYPLHRFSHDLARLRAARRFEHAGKRLELQTAVHDRAYGKSLWVPEERGAGAYYQSIAFR